MQIYKDTILDFLYHDIIFMTIMQILQNGRHVSVFFIIVLAVTEKNKKQL